jgi:hypothetical protein
MKLRRLAGWVVHGVVRSADRAAERLDRLEGRLYHAGWIA